MNMNIVKPMYRCIIVIYLTIKGTLKVVNRNFQTTTQNNTKYFTRVGRRLVEGLVERLVEGLVESQRRMVRIIIDNPSITIKEMSEAIGISTTAIDKNITTLKKKGIVERVGSDSTGTWKINFPE